MHLSYSRSRMIMNFWNKQVALMKMLGNSASNRRGWISSLRTPGWKHRIQPMAGFLAQRGPYACIREFQWLSSVPSSMSSSIMDIILFRLFPVSNALYTCRTTWLRSQFDTFDSMFFIQGSNSRYEIPIRKKIIIYRLIEHWESIF